MRRTSCNPWTLPFAILYASILHFARSQDPLPAQWMSGKFGMGFRIMAGDYLESHEPTWGLDWTKLVEQYKEVGASWVVVNLSEGAYGTTWMSYHPVLYEINTKPDTTCVPFIGSDSGWDGNCQTAPTPSNSTDYFKQMTDAFHDANIKVIAYVASQGPAMFKAGSNFAFDVSRRKPGEPLRDPCTSFPAKNGPSACFADPDSCCSPSIGNWIKYVKNLPQNGGTIDYPKLHTAYADVIIAYYAEKFKNDIDGWWFDHASESGSCGAGSTCRNDFIDKTAVRNAIRAHQPNVPIAFNTCSNAQKSPLQICAANFEDFTAGHPKPLGGGSPTIPFEDGNYPMVTSVEGTADGFFEKSGWKSLGHVFMPTGTAWNGPTITNVWTTPYPYTVTYDANDMTWGDDITTAEGWNVNATDWFSRVLAAGGAWTWNLPRQSNNPGTYYLLHPNHLALVKEVASGGVSSEVPSQSPSLAESEEPSATPSGSPSSAASEIPSILPSTNPSLLPSISLSSIPSELASSQPSQVPIHVSFESPSAAPNDLLSQSPTESLTSIASSQPSQLPIYVSFESPSAAPNDLLSQSPTESLTSTPSSIPTTFPSQTLPESQSPSKKNEISVISPSQRPSLSPSKADPILKVTIPAALTLGNITVPEDTAQRDVFLSVVTQTIKQMLDTGASLDVIITAINGITFNAPKINKKSDEADIEFDIVQEIPCDGSCADTFSNVNDIASQTTGQLAQSLSNGIFQNSLTENASTEGVSALQSVAVDASSFISTAPEVEVVTSVPTFAPTKNTNSPSETSLVPSLVSPSPTTSKTGTEEDTIMKLVLRLLLAIINFLLSNMGKFMG